MFRNVAFIICILRCLEGITALTTCEDSWIAYKGSCYLFQNGQQYNNLDAERFCNRYHGNLVFVNDVHENNFLTSFMAQFGRDNYWIGITDELVEGEWLSISDNKMAVFTDWSPGEPESNSHQANEDCVAAYIKHQYHWDDVPCDRASYVVCEKPGSNGELSEVVG